MCTRIEVPHYALNVSTGNFPTEISWEIFKVKRIHDRGRGPYSFTGRLSPPDDLHCCRAAMTGPVAVRALAFLCAPTAAPTPLPTPSCPAGKYSAPGTATAYVLTGEFGLASHSRSNDSGHPVPRCSNVPHTPAPDSLQPNRLLLKLVYRRRRKQLGTCQLHRLSCWRVAPATGSTRCTACAIGTYQDKEGKGACSNCWLAPITPSGGHQ